MLLAGRVCLRLGVDDPEQWLEDVPERVFQFWQTFYAVEPWGNERLMMAKVVHYLSVLVGMKASDEEAIVKICESMPAEWHLQPEPVETSLDDQLDMVAKAFQDAGL